MSTDLTVARLSVTPAKGLQLHHPDRIDLTAEAPPATGSSTSSTTSGATGSPSRAERMLVAGAVDPAAPVDTDTWGLRTITSDVGADPAWGIFLIDTLVAEDASRLSGRRGRGRPMR